MSDEQRRSSLRHAGAVEFMAPEQNEGHMLFQTDVYSFGVIMFELLAGRVPFPLQDKGETARNIVRLSHIETPAPDIFPLRKENMPATWTSEKKDREMHLPDWLVKMTYKCLNKEPEKRFKNGIDLYDFIHHNIAHTSEIKEASFVPEKLVKEREELQNQLAQYQQLLSVKERELSDLKGRLSSADLASKGVIVERDEYYVPQQKNGVSKTVFISLLLVTIALAAFSAYSLIKRGQNNSAKISTTAAPEKDTTVSVIDVPTQTLAADTAEQPENAEKPLTTLDTTNKAKAPPIPEPKRQEDIDTADEEVENDAQTIEEQPQEVPVKQTSNYVVVSRAYFHSEPDENTRRAAYIIPSNSTVVTALDEKNGFIYVIFDNRVTKTSGWLRKTDLQTVNR
jgi:serine/threonine-protein kinase